MASEKQRRKSSRQARKVNRLVVGPFRHPDGDRRHRGGIRVEDAIAQKRMMQELYGAVLPPSDEEE